MGCDVTSSSAMIACLRTKDANELIASAAPVQKKNIIWNYKFHWCVTMVTALVVLPTIVTPANRQILKTDFLGDQKKYKYGCL